MNKRSWEGFVCFLCDWWWLVLLIIALAVTAVLTRNLWLPLITAASATIYKI